MSEEQFKDHFSGHADQYARYRPVYPAALFDWLAQQCPVTRCSWDCATGSGQAALALADHFNQVIATDASSAQIAKAIPSAAINYRVRTAENSGIDDASIDLVVVAQALHWFDIKSFFREVDRVLKPGGVLAIISYNLLQIEPAIDAVINELYGDVLEAFWPPERRLIEEAYAGIDLPYPEIIVPAFSMQTEWNLASLLGYLETWSAVQRYTKKVGRSPVERVAELLAAAWGDPSSLRHIAWPLSVRVAVSP